MIDILLAIDPGKASGFVVLDVSDIENRAPSVVTAEEFDQYTTCAQAHYILSKNDDAYNVQVVMEDFIITSRTASKKVDRWYSLEIIGAVRYFAELYKAPFTLQSPSVAKTFVENDRIRELGLWVKGGEGHHKDAMRHGILYCVKELNWRPEGLL